jgi:hypothetical protein
MPIKQSRIVGASILMLLLISAIVAAIMMG